MTFRETTCTLAEAKATAVSAITSAFTDPRPPVALAWKENSKRRWLSMAIDTVKLFERLQSHYP